MQGLQISVCPEQINTVLLVLKNKHSPKKSQSKTKKPQQTLGPCFTFVGKFDLMTGLVNVLDRFARLQSSLWGLEFQPQGPSVI